MGVFLQILSLFVIMAVGFTVAKMKLIEASAIKGLSNLIVKVSLPALIITSMQKPFSRDLLTDAIETLVVAFLFYAFILALSLVAVKLLRVSRKKAGVLVFSLGFSNAAFIGFPVISSILGTETLFLASIHTLVFNVLAFSIGVLIIGGVSGGGKLCEDNYVPDGASEGLGAVGDATGDENTGVGIGNRDIGRIKFRNIINITVLSALFGFVLFLGSVPIPEFIFIPLKMLGELTTPLAMIVTGAILSRTPIKNIIGDWKLYVVSLLRLILWPFLAAIVLRIFGVTGDLYYITIIVAGMPAASNTSLLAEVYEGDADTASAIVFMTSLFSVITIPLLALVIN